MKNPKKKKIALTVSLIAIVVFAVVLVNAVFYSSASDITAPTNENVAIPNNDYPVSLSIPAIKLTAKVQEVGVTTDGKMAVPTNYTDVGWYKYGPLPGQVGAAVIAGHVDDGLALPAVFINLSELKPGDDIYVTMKDGQQLHFVMTGSQTYDRNANTESIFHTDDNTSRILRLITCAGTWIPSLATHNERLVVTAVLK
jgi:LPXTG-site transpeptidase (sortase) family protein